MMCCRLDRETQGMLSSSASSYYYVVREVIVGPTQAGRGKQQGEKYVQT